jgi:Cdc6-like AAA superfamily ATPase
MMVKHWMNEARDLSYDIEDYIDKTMHPGGPNSREELRSDSEVEELSTLVKQAKDAHERHNRYDLGRWASNPRFVVDGGGQGWVPRLNGDATDLVGISDSKAELIKRLNIDAEQRLIVSIQGPEGVGKTTLAKEVFREIERLFECRAFVRASKMPDTRRLLGSIISQIQRGHQNPPHVLPVQELIDILKTHLLQKRCSLLFQKTCSMIGFPFGYLYDEMVDVTESIYKEKS